MTADTVDLLVRQMRVESAGVVSLRLEHSDGAAVDRWTPGAHLDLHLGGGSSASIRCAATPTTRPDTAWPSCTSVRGGVDLVACTRPFAPATRSR